MLTLAVGIKNRAKELRLTLGSMIYHSGDVLKRHKDSIELLVLDRQSTDNLQDVLESVKDYFNIRLIQVDLKRAGVRVVSTSGAVLTNLSFLLARGDRVLHFQPETLFLKDNITFMLEHDDLEFRVPMASTFDGQIKLSPGVIEDIEYDVLLLDHKATYINQPGMSYHLTEDEDLGSALVASDLDHPFYPWVWGCLTDLFLQTGLIDMDFLGGWAAEDDFMMLRLGQLGAYLHVVDDMVAYHMWHKRTAFAGSRFHQRNIAVLDGLRNINPMELQRRAERNRRISLRCVV